ncbi:MAG: Lrp/AsnC ligand binding domain-containing protein [Candidatus Bathyarchaeia archaeon]
MNEAYVLINTELGAEGEVLEALKEVNEVVEAYIAYGVYDIIVKVEVENSQEKRSKAFYLKRRSLKSR